MKGQGHLIVISKFIGNYLPFCYRIKHSCSVVCWIGPRADVGGGQVELLGKQGLRKMKTKAAFLLEKRKQKGLVKNE